MPPSAFIMYFLNLNLMSLHKYKVIRIALDQWNYLWKLLLLKIISNDHQDHIWCWGFCLWCHAEEFAPTLCTDSQLHFFLTKFVLNRSKCRIEIGYYELFQITDQIESSLWLLFSVCFLFPFFVYWCRWVHSCMVITTRVSSHIGR
jgi:hypothetical protein